MGISIDTKAIKFPALMVAAEGTSKSSQRAFFWATGGQFGLLAAAAATSLLPAGELWNLGPIATLAFFLGALAIQLSGVQGKAESRWYAARAAAESIKSASWEYMVCGEAFRAGDAAAEDRFRGTLSRILKQLSTSLQIGAATAENASVTPSMRAIRQSSQADRAEVYKTCRVADQVTWYTDKAKTHGNRARLFLVLTIALEAVAVLLGILRINGTVEGDFISVFAAGAAGLLGWSQAKKYGEHAAAYSVTSHDVSLIEPTLDPTLPEKAWAQAIHDAEAAFSREHTMWQARRQGPI